MPTVTANMTCGGGRAPRARREMGMVSAKKRTPKSCIMKEVVAGVVQRGGAPGEREDGHQVEEDEGGEADQDAGDQRAGMVAERRSSMGTLTRLSASSASRKTGVSVIVRRT